MYKLSLDRKQIEEMLLLGLRVSGFNLASDRVTWDRKKGTAVSASVQVSADQNPLINERKRTQVPKEDPTAAYLESSPEADPPPQEKEGVTIPDQEGSMPPEEVDRILRQFSEKQ